MRNKRAILAISILFVLIVSSDSLAYKVETHASINETVAQRTLDGFSLNDYLINDLGIAEGVKSEIKGSHTDTSVYGKIQRIYEWLGYGGSEEDLPHSDWDYAVGNPTRAVNHFHDPLKTWDEAGLDDYVIIARTGQSSILWAQNKNQDPYGKWSWYDARENFYTALTGRASDGTVIARHNYARQYYLADTFRALGQVMHLFQDSSVPEHVRNDAHVFRSIEHYINERVVNEEGKTEWDDEWDALLQYPVFFNEMILSIFSNTPEETDPIHPISAIIDANQYNGSNPGDTATDYFAPPTIGLAEYANANFLSKDSARPMT